MKSESVEKTLTVVDGIILLFVVTMSSWFVGTFLMGVASIMESELK